MLKCFVAEYVDKAKPLLVLVVVGMVILVGPVEMVKQV
jgi:hypothetical protein